jgi:hypothetical protein
VQDGVMATQTLRFDQIRDSTQELLSSGEQPHIEFKSEVVIKSVAKQVAAGANLIALQPAIGVHTILFGVDEEIDPVTSITTGVVVGLTFDGTGAADLDSLQLQLEQSIRSTVRPQPNIVIYQENVSSKPILVLEVRPATAPHVVDERWVIRGVAGVRGMSQDEALQIFKNQRLSAWIDEFEDSDPLKQALNAIHGSIDEIRLAQFAVDPFETFRERSADSSDDRAFDETLGRLEYDISGVVDSLSQLQSTVEDTNLGLTRLADDNTGESAEDVWRSTMTSRMMRLHTVHSFASSVGATRLKLVDDMVDDFLGDTADLTAFAANLAEVSAYRTLRRANTSPPVESAAASDLVSASLWRSNGMPPSFGFDWLANVVSGTPDVLVRTIDTKDVGKGYASEVGLLCLPSMVSAELSKRMGGTISRNGRVISVATATGVYRIAVPSRSSVWPIVFTPGVFVDSDPNQTVEQVAKRITEVVVSSGGSSWSIEGAELSIPTIDGA